MFIFIAKRRLCADRACDFNPVFFGATTPLYHRGAPDNPEKCARLTLGQGQNGVDTRRVLRAEWRELSLRQSIIGEV